MLFDKDQYDALKLDLKFTGRKPYMHIRGLGEQVDLGDQFLVCKLADARVEQRGRDAFGQVSYCSYLRLIARSRANALTAEGYLIVHDRMMPGRAMDGWNGGTLWQLYEKQAAGHDWFCAADDGAYPASDGAASVPPQRMLLYDSTFDGGTHTHTHTHTTHTHTHTHTPAFEEIKQEYHSPNPNGRKPSHFCTTFVRRKLTAGQPAANLVLIATPNFGSFVAGNFANGFGAGSQDSELVPGSALLWNLATWNQRGDDLAGVNAIAIIGNAGAYATLTSTTELLGASDGLVSTTSASMTFVSQEPALTRIVVPYCHIDPSAFTNTALGAFNCDAPGIANITSASHPTSVIVRSFLAGTTDWQSVGIAPTADAYLATNGGTFFAMQNSTAQYVTDLTSVTWGNVTLTDGGNLGTIYYTDFVTGSGDYTAVSTSLGKFNCGTLAVSVGYFAATRCKIGLAITSVTPTSTAVTGRAVISGTSITLNGASFGAQCGTCKVYATPAGSTTPQALTVTSWTNTAIVAQLPASLTGYQTISVDGTAGIDAIGVRALAASAQSTMTVTPAALQYAYTVGETLPASQPIAISSSGGTLAWTATVTGSWLSVDSASGTAPSTINVSVAPASLAAGTYNGTIQIASTGASNSPITVAVTLVVTAAPAILVVTPASLSFEYAAGSAAPAAQSLSITNGGGGTFSWVASSGAYWATLSASSGAVPGTVSVSLNAGNLAAGSYAANVTIAAADGSVTPVTVPVTVTVEGTPPAPAITAVANAASYQTSFASATWVAIFGTNLSQITYSWQAGDIVNGALPTSLEGVSVSINGVPAYISYISPTQINVLAPDDATLGSVPVLVTTAGQASNSFAAQKVQFAPAFLTFDGTYVAAQHLDSSLVGKPGLLAGAATTPAAPGETIIMYAVGFGPTNPQLPTGQVVTAAAPLANTVQFSIGGVAVTPSFAGLSGSGLYQFNVTVPASLASGDAAVLAIIGGVGTQTGVEVTVQ